MSTLNNDKNRNIYDSLIEYIEENQNKFYLLAYSYIKERDGALDTVQNAIYKALISWETLKNPEYIKTWFYRILVNSALDELRTRKKLYPTAPEKMPEETYSPLDSEADCLDLRAAMDTLEPELKSIIIMKYFEDMKLDEISKITGLNINTLKSKLYRGLKKLKIKLEREVFSDE